MSRNAPTTGGASEARRLLGDVLRPPAGADVPALVEALRRFSWFQENPTDAAHLFARNLRGRGESTLPSAFWFFVAEVCARGGEEALARPAVESGLARVTALDDPDEVGAAYALQGILDGARNDWEHAVWAWEESLKLLSIDHPLEMRIHRLLGEGWEALGQPDRALANLEEALRLAAQRGAAGEECELCSLLARQSLDGGATEQAAAYLERALRRARESGCRAAEANAIVGYGEFCLEIGETERAVPTLRQGLALARELGDALLQAVALQRLAEVLQRDGDLDQARALLEEAVFLAKGSGSPAALASLYQAIALLHESAGKGSMALAAYERAVTERRLADDTTGLGATLNNLGALYATMGDPDTARRFYSQAALAFAERGPARRECLIVLENMRRLEAEHGDRLATQLEPDDVIDPPNRSGFFGS